MDKRFIVFIFVLIVLLTVRLFSFYLSRPIHKDGEAVSIQTTLLDEPKNAYNYQTFWIQDKSGQRILVKTKSSIIYSYGDNLKVSGNLKIRVLNKNSLVTLNNPQIVLEKPSGASFLAVSGFIRQRIIGFFQNSLNSNDSSLMLGIVFGIKQDFSRNFLNNLKTVGVMHVIAASGMNVTLVGGFIFYAFSQVLKRQKAIVVSVLFILFYAFLAGFQASIIRASIMYIASISAEILGKQKYSQYALFLTGFLMLFSSPAFLLDIGFQLSFASTLGILVIPKFLNFGKNPFSQDLSTTVSAQIATFPIILSSFSIYSFWSVLVNVFVLWTVPILMIMGGLATIISFIYEPVAKIILYLCIPLLYYFEKIVSIFAGFGGSISFQDFPWQFFVSYYLFLLTLLIFFSQKHTK
ncbi:MAG TPA: ComEC/Rec2 family competence protein [Candidatus Sulfotelmatobacter sp.]|nr:ComEC/Rec2 family competence protein [Candidatus Sulfotelmatobacter sp.]